MGDAEFEWQFKARDLGLVEGWLRDRAIPSAPPDDHVDTYLDTTDCRLDQDGYSVRLRRREGAPVLATLKSLGGVREDGLNVRLELEEELDLADPLDLAQAPGAVGRRVRELVGERELHPLFDVDTHRSVFPLSVGGELVLDATAIREPDGGKLLGRLQRVEVEVPESAVSAVRPLVESLRRDLALQPAESSKYEAARAVSVLHHSSRKDNS